MNQRGSVALYPLRYNVEDKYDSGSDEVLVLHDLHKKVYEYVTNCVSAYLYSPYHSRE